MVVEGEVVVEASGGTPTFPPNDLSLRYSLIVVEGKGEGSEGKGGEGRKGKGGRKGRGE